MTTGVRKALSSATAAEIYRDVAVVAGLATAGYGIWMLNHPAAIIYAGLTLAGLVFLSTPKETDGSGS